jgi:hypothetical protein
MLQVGLNLDNLFEAGVCVERCRVGCHYSAACCVLRLLLFLGHAKPAAFQLPSELLHATQPAEARGGRDRQPGVCDSTQLPAVPTGGSATKGELLCCLHALGLVEFVACTQVGPGVCNMDRARPGAAAACLTV